MGKRTRRAVEVVILVVLALALLGRLPHYSYIRMSGPDGTTVVESTGPGPHTVTVVGKDGSIAKNRVW